MMHQKQSTEQLTDRQNKQQQKQQHPVEVIGDYELGKTIGKGTFGKVKQGVHKITKQKVAIKIIDKDSIQDQDDKIRVNRQVQILRLARHPNIIHLYEIIQATDHIYIITEFAEKGQLFHLMSNEVRLKQRTAGRIFIQILNAVSYLHRLKIAHRDLKPQNILLDVDFNIKLIDFGLSNYKEQGKLLQTACGSPCYAPPQMVAGNPYDGIIGDIWSLGIIFYAMICGSMPFEQKTTKELYEKVIEGFYVLPSDISLEATEVIRKMLVTDPTKRIDIGQLRKLKFFQNIKQLQPQIIGIIVGHHPMPIDNQIIDRMKPLLQFDKKLLQQDLKQNKHNQRTATYYLMQKKALRQGGRTVVDLQVFLQTHDKYKKDYGRQSLEKRYAVSNKLQQTQKKILNKKLKTEKSPQRKNQGNLNVTPTKIPKTFSNQKLRKRFYSTQDKIKTAKKQIQSNTLKLPIRKHHIQNSTQRNRDIQTARDSSRDFSNRLPTSPPTNNSQSKNKKKLRLIKSKEKIKANAMDLWHAYFEKSFDVNVKEKKNGKKTINKEQQQKINLYNDNIKKLKEGFLKLPNMKKK